MAHAAALGAAKAEARRAVEERGAAEAALEQLRGALEDDTERVDREDALERETLRIERDGLTAVVARLQGELQVASIARGESRHVSGATSCHVMPRLSR